DPAAIAQDTGNSRVVAYGSRCDDLLGREGHSILDVEKVRWRWGRAFEVFGQTNALVGRSAFRFPRPGLGGGQGCGCCLGWGWRRVRKGWCSLCQCREAREKHRAKHRSDRGPQRTAMPWVNASRGGRVGHLQKHKGRDGRRKVPPAAKPVSHSSRLSAP